MKPLENAMGQWQWFRAGDRDSKSETHNGDGVVRGHWLVPVIFDALRGGTLLPMMGIRLYESESAAMEAIR